MEDKKTEVSPWRRAYGVTEFAQLYFPGHTPVVAYKRMWEWIRTSRGLKAKPEAAGWKCACGAINKGKFCSECGAKKPAQEPLYRCDKCGWEPEDATKPPKFCPECGDPFDDGDIMRS